MKSLPAHIERRHVTDTCPICFTHPLFQSKVYLEGDTCCCFCGLMTKWVPRQMRLTIPAPPPGVLERLESTTMRYAAGVGASRFIHILGPRDGGWHVRFVGGASFLVPPERLFVAYRGGLIVQPERLRHMQPRGGM